MDRCSDCDITDVIFKMHPWCRAPPEMEANNYEAVVLTIISSQRQLRLKKKDMLIWISFPLGIGHILVISLRLEKFILSQLSHAVRSKKDLRKRSISLGWRYLKGNWCFRRFNLGWLKTNLETNFMLISEKFNWF